MAWNYYASIKSFVEPELHLQVLGQEPFTAILGLRLGPSARLPVEVAQKMLKFRGLPGRGVGWSPKKAKPRATTSPQSPRDAFERPSRGFPNAVERPTPNPEKGPRHCTGVYTNTPILGLLGTRYAAPPPPPPHPWVFPGAISTYYLQPPRSKMP